MPLPRLHALMVGALCVLLAGGCEGIGSRPPSGADKLEQMLKIERAQVLLTVPGSPEPAADSREVEERAKSVYANCRATRPQTFECIKEDYGGIAQCAVRTDEGVTRVRWSRCGAGHPPTVDFGHVDCARVGRLITSSDPPLDIAYNQVVKPANVPEHPQPAMVDLRRVRVAVSGQAICVQWLVAARIERPYVAVFQAQRHDPAEALTLELSLPVGQPPNLGSDTWSIDGRVDIVGRAISVLVDRDAVAGPAGRIFHGSFEYEAAVRRRVGGTAKRPYLYLDQLDYGVRRPVYR